MYERVCPRSCTKSVPCGEHIWQVSFRETSLIINERVHFPGDCGFTAHVPGRDGRAWRSPVEKADCRGIVHAARPASCAPRLYFCGADRQTPAECAQTAAENGRDPPPA